MLPELLTGESVLAVCCKSCDLQFAFQHDASHNREPFKLPDDQRCFITNVPRLSGVNCYLAVDYVLYPCVGSSLVFISGVAVWMRSLCVLKLALPAIFFAHDVID